MNFKLFPFFPHSRLRSGKILSNITKKLRSYVSSSMPLKVDDAIEIYEEYAKFPAIVSGRICNLDTPGHVRIYSEWTQRDLDRKEKVVFGRSHIVQLDVVVPTPPHEISNEQWNKESPTGRYRAIVRKRTDDKGKEIQCIEIWDDRHKLHNFEGDGEALKQHGKIYHDAQFGCLEWGHSETHLLYIAERKRPKPKSFFDKDTTDTPAPTDDQGERGDEFVYREDWGEQLVGKADPVVCVLDVESGAVSVLDNLPDDVSPGQAIWCPDDLGVICVGWSSDPYRLGLIYCTNRKSALYHIDLKTFKCSTLGQTDQSVLSPVFSPDHSKLVFLEHTAGGPHDKCSKLRMCDWSNKGVVDVLDVVRQCKNPADFPGVFCPRLRHRCFAKDNRRLVMESQWRSTMELVVVDCELGAVTRLTNDPVVSEWSLLDIREDLVLAACSSPNQATYLVIGQLPHSGKEGGMKWQRLDSDPEGLPEVRWTICSQTVAPDHVNPKYEGLDYEYILLEPAIEDSKAKLPLVVFPHGGPHSVIPAAYSLYTACLCRCGYMVALVNFRGSIGFGQDSIDSLPGNIGTQDVNDVQAVANHLVQSGRADPERVVVIGGSHGGFITAHLIGQFPDFYKAAVCRNPVINVASMLGTTDIPDWNYVESGFPFSHKDLGGPDVYKAAWEKSPIRHIDQVKAPVMLMVGQDDARVPPQQSHEFRKELQARGVKVRMLLYPGNSHPIIKVDSEADAFINIIKWFGEHIGCYSD